MQKLTWIEWQTAVGAQLGTKNLSAKDSATLSRWYNDGLTVRAAAVNIRATWETGTGNHPMVDFAAACMREAGKRDRSSE